VPDLLRCRLEARPEAMIDLVEPVSTTNGYGPFFPTHTPTVTNLPPEVAAPLDGDVVCRSVTAFELERVVTLTGTAATAG
jgi:hypothetical protein